MSLPPEHPFESDFLKLDVTTQKQIYDVIKARRDLKYKNRISYRQETRCMNILEIHMHILKKLASM